ncbi:EAL domain-containing protein [Salinivibrio sp. ES.052]|uniref:bifunctional diguanylate cyclase/phosphodiesterase n=1 Tax=Salinivibrio sp. ES.052 TaxID=1882823 RepID=UPI000928341F|nr:EAL domain-containing protein [Salinivibrio sp. ES.052]SIO32165.1 periplasmic sensor diguanylate cyclase/phosphodiesterase [Salinivibrio sp. ES.052]
MTRTRFITLHSKAALIFVLGLLGIIFSSLLLTRYFFLFGINHLEDIEITKANQQAKAVIQRVIDNQVEYAIDWAYWDDTYELLTTTSSDYAERNLEDETLIALGLDMMGFADLNGHVVEAKVIGDANEKSIIDAIYRSPAVAAHINQSLPDQALSPLSGLLKLRGHIWVVSVNPIRDSSGATPAVGWMVWGQTLTGRFPSAYDNILAGNNRLADNDYAAGRAAVDRIIRTDDKITRYTSLYDLSHLPIAALETSEPRRYFQKGKQVFQYLILALLAMTSFIALLVYLLYRHNIARQFISFEKSVNALLGDTAPQATPKDTFTRITEQIEALASASSHAEQQLQETLAKFDALYHSQHLGMIILENERIVDVNQALLKLLGHQRKQLVDTSLDTLLSNTDGIHALLTAFQHQKNQSVVNFETNLRCATGQAITCNIEAIRLDSQAPHTAMLAVKDISQQKQQAELIETLSHHDTLSGLLNRPSTTKALNEALDESKTVFTLYFIATRLREIYEIYGHEAYDSTVKHIADSLQNQFPHATVGRLSENEFIVFTDGMAEYEFVRHAHTVLKASANHLFATSAEFDIGLKAAMLGPALAFTHFEPLVHCGYFAIEQQEGPNHNVTIVDDNTAKAAQETLVINRNLVSALKNNEFTAYFQPIVNATSNQVIGFEALARWHHLDLGMISPGVFIPLAEKHKLIIELDELVLEKACAFLQTMQKHWSKKSQHRLTIHVNLSSPHFGARQLLDKLKRLINRYQLAPGQLVLEVTESILLGADKETIKRMHALKALGVQLALDDFGTGYSSFSSLCNFPLDIVKLDKSYMSEIETNDKAKTLVRSIINMAQELGMTTVAEGVETASQLRILNVWRVDEIQGFYFFKPMSAEQAVHRLVGNE